MTVLAVTSLQEYFRDALHAAFDHQHVQVDDHTEHYVVSLLTLYSRTDALYDCGPGGIRQKPLVVMLTEALEAQDSVERCRGLQRLGDVSLFVAGFFAQGFARKLIDIDYHIAMGGRAYAVLAESLQGRQRAALCKVFGELSVKFQHVVDALNEISESGYQHSDQDILRLYETWLNTGSRRAHGLLGKLGVLPAQTTLRREH